MDEKSYLDFLSNKTFIDPPTGIIGELPELNDKLKPFQRDIVSWALRRGRAALFADTGLGKTFMQLEWANKVQQHTKGRVLLLAPLAVAKQTELEAEKWGINGVLSVKENEDKGDIVYVTNYDKLHKFNPSDFSGIVLDESSIIKNQDGKTRDALIAAFKETPFRLAATATPAPNDFMELGNHAQFLGAMTQHEMLATFFLHDGGSTQNWRIKGHAEDDFWKWVSSWSVLVRNPSDLGYEDAGYILPTLHQHQVTVEISHAPEDTGMLLQVEAQTLQDRIIARKQTIKDRVNAAVKIVNNKPDEPWLIWCGLNDEADMITNAIDDAIQVSGSNTEVQKEDRLLGFSSGKYRVLVTKAKIAGHGMNWQHCANMVFVGLNDSFEQMYQALRRCWRFGQTREVNAWIVASDREGAVVKNVQRKEKDARRMADNMIKHMGEIQKENIQSLGRNVERYNGIQLMSLPEWI